MKNYDTYKIVKNLVDLCKTINPLMTSRAIDDAKDYIEYEEGLGLDYATKYSLILSVVCKYYRLPTTAILSRSRREKTKKARFICQWLARTYTKDSLEDIGFVLGERNHSTVLHAYKTVRNWINTDDEWGREVITIEEKYLQRVKNSIKTEVDEKIKDILIN